MLVRLGDHHLGGGRSLLHGSVRRRGSELSPLTSCAYILGRVVRALQVTKPMHPLMRDKYILSERDEKPSVKFVGHVLECTSCSSDLKAIFGPGYFCWVMPLVLDSASYKQLPDSLRSVRVHLNMCSLCRNQRTHYKEVEFVTTLSDDMEESVRLLMALWDMAVFGDANAQELLKGFIKDDLTWAKVVEGAERVEDPHVQSCLTDFLLLDDVSFPLDEDDEEKLRELLHINSILLQEVLDL